MNIPAADWPYAPHPIKNDPHFSYELEVVIEQRDRLLALLKAVQSRQPSTNEQNTQTSLL